MKGKSKVYIVTRVHNRCDYMGPFLKFMHLQIWPNLTVIIVDDGSTDGTSKMIEGQFPEVILLHGDGNLWWTAATNTGIREALKTASDEDYVLVINDDLEVNPDYLTNLASFANKNPRSLVGSVTLDFDNPDVIGYGWITVNWWTAKYRIFNRGRRLSEFCPGHWLEVWRCPLLPGEAFSYPFPLFTSWGSTTISTLSTVMTWNCLYERHGKAIGCGGKSVSPIHHALRLSESSGDCNFSMTQRRLREAINKRN